MRISRIEFGLPWPDCILKFDVRLHIKNIIHVGTYEHKTGKPWFSAEEMWWYDDNYGMDITDDFEEKKKNNEDV